jgi:hypothetical protein
MGKENKRLENRNIPKNILFLFYAYPVDSAIP